MLSEKKKLLYFEAYNKILAIMSSNNYQEGDMLPGRKELMEITGMSQRPIQQAINILSIVRKTRNKICRKATSVI